MIHSVFHVRATTWCKSALGCTCLLAACFALAQSPVPPVKASPDQVPVVDPFARNVNRPTQYGAVPVVKPKEERKINFGADLQYQYDDDLARLPDLRNYRVVAISTKTAAAKPHILGPDLAMPPLGTSARKVYLRLYSHANLAQAKQYIWDFFDANKKLIDANFLIRRDKEEGRPVFRVEMGPFASERHALLYCAQVVADKSKAAQSCVTNREFKTAAEKPSFRSTASVGLSAAMVQQIANTNKSLDATRLFSAAYDITEGDTLGRNEFVVIKINQRGVLLAGESGHLFLLPSDIIPLPSSADDVMVED
jgi:hypothetical protein